MLNRLKYLLICGFISVLMLYSAFRLEFIAIFLFTFFLYFAKRPPDNIATSYWHIFYKCLPTMVLLTGTVLSSSWPMGAYAFYICLGQIFSIFGDAFLSHDASKDHLLKLGIGNFALAHIFYIIAFGVPPHEPIGGPALLCSIISIVIIGILLLDHIRPIYLKIMGVIYMSIVFTAVWRAASMEGDYYAKHGMQLFALSDVLLSYRMFISDFKYSYYIVMGTYYGAQLFIALSI